MICYSQMVESVTQCSPAHAAGLKKNDILLAVNGTYLHSGHQAAKLFTTNNINGDSNSILLRVKRLIQPESKKVRELELVCLILTSVTQNYDRTLERQWSDSVLFLEFFIHISHFV